MITAIVIAQIDPEAVNEKIETALEDDEEFQKKIEERKKELDALREEIERIKKDPFKKIDPKKKDQLKQQIASVIAQIKKAKEDEKQGKTIQGEVVKMQADLAKMMKELDQAEEDWELMKDPEKFATVVIVSSRESKLPPESFFFLLMIQEKGTGQSLPPRQAEAVHNDTQGCCIPEPFGSMR